MTKFIYVFSVLFSIQTFASEVCGRSRISIKELLEDPAHRIAFKNNGGLFNSGVCWWHSRLQRSSIYLARFAPSAPRPNLKQVQKILSSLRFMDQVVTIPGFDDFESFSKAHQNETQLMLNAWQRSDGFLDHEWIRGISGRSRMPAHLLSLKMEEIYQAHILSPLPIWIMAQIKGVTAHSFLVVEMNRVPEGLHLRLIDSNKPLIIRDLWYKNSGEYLHIEGTDYTFVPYLGFQEDFRRISSALKAHCPGLHFQDMDQVPRGDIEVE